MDTLTISKKLIATGIKAEQAEAIAQVVEDKNQELATKKDLKLLATVLVGIMSAGFGYLINAINNNNDLLAVIIGKLG